MTRKKADTRIMPAYSFDASINNRERLTDRNFIESALNRYAKQLGVHPSTVEISEYSIPGSSGYSCGISGTDFKLDIITRSEAGIINGIATATTRRKLLDLLYLINEDYGFSDISLSNQFFGCAAKNQKAA